MELVKGDILSAFVGSPAFADGCCFGFGRRVERIGRFIGQYGGTDGNGPLAAVNSTKSPGLMPAFLVMAPGTLRPSLSFTRTVIRVAFKNLLLCGQYS